MTKKKIKVLDLFAGAGGFSLGFDLVKDKKGNKAFEIVLTVDSDKYACQTLRKYFINEYGENYIVLEADLTDKATHKKIIEKCQESIDIIIGGPPCQSFSLIGARSGNNNSNHHKYKIMDSLYKEYLALVKELKPSFIVYENVKGILSKKDNRGRGYIDIIISDFKNLGYSFESENGEVNTDFIILTATDYGVPQARERVFLIGNNLGIKNPYPSATNSMQEYVTLFESIGDLPKLKAKTTYTDIRNQKERENIERQNSRIYNGADSVEYHKDLFKAHYKSLGKTGKAFLDFVKPNGQVFLTHHVARGQKKNDILLFRGMRQGMTASDVFKSKRENIRKLRRLIKYNMSSFLDKYRKQSWNKPCSTVFAHLEKDGNRFIHPAQPRTITPREAARIQSFPDWYEFEGPFVKKFWQIGNAVPPLLAMSIGKAMMKIIRCKND